jgi:hypothetical protein
MSLQPSIDTGSRHYPSLLTAWGFMQRELIFISWSLMEVSLLTPVVLAIWDWASYWPPGQVALWLMLMMLMSFNLVRLMSLLWLPPATQRNIISVALLLMMVISLPTLLYRPLSLFDLSWLARFYENAGESGRSLWTRDLSVLLLIIFMWWRGIRMAHQGFGIQRAGLRLRIGSLMIAPLVVWSGSRLTWSVMPFLLLFFLAALVSVTLIRAEQLERDHSGSSVSLKPRWLIVVFIASLMTVFVAGAVATFASGDTALIIASWLTPLWLAFSLTLTTVGNTVGYLAQPLFTILGFIIYWLAEGLRRLFTMAFEGGLSLPIFELPTVEATAEVAVDSVETSFDGGKAITLLLLLALVLVVALSLVRLYQHSTLAARRDEARMGDSRQSRERESGLGQRILERLEGWRHWRAAASIRRVYRDMGRAADASGYPRALSETPYEYQKALNEVWPHNQSDSYLITQAYVRIRYGEFPETKAELDEILAAWQRLERSQPAAVAKPAAEP